MWLFWSGRCQGHSTDEVKFRTDPASSRALAGGMRSEVMKGAELEEMLMRTRGSWACWRHRRESAGWQLSRGCRSCRLGSHLEYELAK